MAFEWLLGASGLMRGAPESGWTAVGQANYPVNTVLDRGDDLIVGTEGGLWQVSDDRWIQWHDETMTLVLGLASVDVGVGVVVASAYGLATGFLDEHNVPRWRWHSDGLMVNARYSNAVITDPNDNTRWLAGTEAGVWVCEGNGERWIESSLSDRPVRTLCCAQDAFWAGAHTGGIWRSEDGVQWTQLQTGLDDVPVYSLVFTGQEFIAGTERGVAVGDNAGHWVLTEPALRIRTVQASDKLWLAGGNPGGLWISEDRGQVWRRSGAFHSVNAIALREEG